jgi:hypothetical protein
MCLDDAILDHFLEVQKVDDIAEMQMVGNAIARRLALHHDDAVADAAQRILGGLNDFFRFGEKISGAPKNYHLPAGQQAAFFPALVHADAYRGSVNVQAILVCDEDQQFGEALRHIFEEACITGDNPYLWEFGATESLTNIMGIDQASSDDSFGIQIADLAAGLVNRIAVARLRSQRLTTHQRRVLATWRSSFVPRRYHFFMASDAALRHMLPTLFIA